MSQLLGVFLFVFNLYLLCFHLFVFSNRRCYIESIDFFFLLFYMCFIFFNFHDRIHCLLTWGIGMSKYIHAIIFSDKSGTMDFIFRDLRPFSGTDPPFFFNYRPSLYSAMPKPNGAKY